MFERSRWQTVVVGITAFVAVLEAPAWANDAPACVCLGPEFADNCAADISRDAEQLRFSVDTTQCARVDWYLGDTPLATMVKGGAEALQLEDIDDDTETRVRACRVCQVESPPRSVSDAILGSAKRVPPRYPRKAFNNALEGYVDMMFTVKADGTPADIVVTYSTNSIFERSAVKALSQWKLKPHVVDGEPVDTPGLETRTRFVMSYPP